MFGNKTIDTIVAQFTTMVYELDTIINSEIEVIRKTDEGIIELQVDRESANLNKERAEKIQKNILALIK